MSCLTILRQQERERYFVAEDDELTGAILHLSVYHIPAKIVGNVEGTIQIRKSELYLPIFPIDTTMYHRKIMIGLY